MADFVPDVEAGYGHTIYWYLDGKLIATEESVIDAGYVAEGISLISNENGVITIHISNNISDSNDEYDYGKEIKHIVFDYDESNAETSIYVYGVSTLQGEWVLNEELTYVDNTFSSGTYSGIYGYFGDNDDVSSYELTQIVDFELSEYAFIAYRVTGNISYDRHVYYNASFFEKGFSLDGDYIYVTDNIDKSSSDGILLRTLVINEGYSCSDEFAVWLTNNSTKKEEEKPTQLVHYYRNNKLISIAGKSCKLRHYSKIKPTEEVGGGS